MLSLLWVLLACSPATDAEAPTPASPGGSMTTAPATTPPAPAPAPAAEAEPLASEIYPEGFTPMRLVMPTDHVGAGLGPGSRVDLVAGEGAEQIVIAEDVELIDIEEEPRGLRVALLLTDDHRTRLLGDTLPAQPRVVEHR